MKSSLICVLAFFVGLMATIAQSTGPMIPANNSTTGLGAGWSNLGGVQYVDNNPAYVDLAQYPTCNSFICYYSDIAQFSGFGFSIPSSATITGIRIEAMQRVSSPGGGIRDSVVVLSLNGVIVGADHSDPSYWFDTPTLNTYGDSTDTWSYNWSPSEINDPSFGLLYRVTNDSYDQPASLDYLAMNVYYETGTGVMSQTSTPWNIRFKERNLIISAEASILAKGFKVDVSDLQGKIYYSHEFDQGQRKLDLAINAASWANGIFVVNVESADGFSFQRKLMHTN